MNVPNHVFTLRQSGVDIFFVISGFIIAKQLCDQILECFVFWTADAGDACSEAAKLDRFWLASGDPKNGLSAARFR